MNISSSLYENEVKKTLKKPELESFQYVNKFKTALIGFFLFIMLSHNVAYKILDLIVKLFASHTDIIDEDGNPMPLGIFINAFITAIILFIF